MPPDWRLFYVRISSAKRLFFEVPLLVLDVILIPSGYGMMRKTLFTLRPINELSLFNMVGLPQLEAIYLIN